ncbi:MAG: cation diffusion facilitator family transporter [Cyanobacteria bacterium J06626_18]
MRWLLLVMVSVTVFAGVELWVGLVSHSLTLRADSGHMLADGLAIGIALTATWAARRSQSVLHSNHRYELLAALINGLALLAMALWIGCEALSHLHGQPTEILSLPMLITAVLGLLINGLNLYWLHGDLQDDLNLRGVFLHVVADLLGSVGAILAAIAVVFLQWTWADTLIGTAVALMIAVGAISLLWQSFQRLINPASAITPSSDQLQQLGWLEVGSTELSRLIE